ncbi:MAG: tetratricopeptide repeat protein [Nitrospinales bacterium]
MKRFIRTSHAFFSLAALCLPVLLTAGCGALDTTLVKLKANTRILKAKANNAVLGFEANAQSFRAAVDPSNLNARADLVYGLRQYNLGHYATARYYFHKALLTFPDHFTALNLLGWTHFFQGRYDKALTAFLRTHGRYPRASNPVMGSAWSYFGLKNYEMALEDFEQAALLGGDAYQVHKGKGFAYLKLQDRDKAREEFAKIFNSRELDQLMADWHEWNAGDPDSPINAVSLGSKFPALFVLPVERPRYPGDLLAHQPAAPSAEIDSAWTLFKKGFYPQAAEQFKNQTGGESLDAANGLAWSYLRADQIIKAERLFRSMGKKFAGFRGAVEGLREVEKTKKEKSAFADRYLNLKKYRLALREFEKLAARYPDWAYPHIKMGDADLAMKKHELARAFYQKALALDPDNRAAQKGIEAVYRQTAPQLFQAGQARQKKNYKTASWLYADYIENQGKQFFRPDTLAEAYNGLGWSYYGKKQYALAIKKFNRARKDKKFAPQAIRGLGLSYYNLGLYRKAARYLAIAHQKQPNENEIAYKLDWSIMQSSSLDQAERHFNEALEKDPLRASSYMGLGWIHYKKKKPDLAVEYFLKAISLDPDFAWTPEFRKLLDKERFGWQVYNRFAWTYYHKKLYPRSLEIFRISLAKAPGKSDTLKGIGYNQFKQKKYREAIASLSQSLATNPDPSPVVERVDNEDAISPFEMETSVRTRLGWSYFHLKNYEQAVAQFSRELEKQPNGSDANDGLGWTFLKMDRLAESRAAFNLAIKSRPLNNSARKGLNQVRRMIAARNLQKHLSPAPSEKAPQTREYAQRGFFH